MILGKVIGTVVSTMKLKIYEHYKLLIVKPIDIKGKFKGKSVIAIDTVQAGINDTVLVIDEGNSARLIINNKMAPVRSVVVGIVDTVNVEN